jgi:hypothetical protein
MVDRDSRGTDPFKGIQTSAGVAGRRPLAGTCNQPPEDASVLFSTSAPRAPTAPSFAHGAKTRGVPRRPTRQMTDPPIRTRTSSELRDPKNCKPPRRSRLSGGRSDERPTRSEGSVLSPKGRRRTRSRGDPQIRCQIRPLEPARAPSPGLPKCRPPRRCRRSGDRSVKRTLRS